MSIKSAVFELKEEILRGNHHQIEEKDIAELHREHRVNTGTLISYYNTLVMLNLSDQKGEKDESKKSNRRWSKVEIQFMLTYIKNRQDEGSPNITEILDEVAQILNRGYQSVNYKYYSVTKVKEEKMPVTEDGAYTYSTIDQASIPVLSIQPIDMTTKEAAVPHPNEEDDLLDLLSGLISNVQQLPGISLTELLKSLYHLTSMAIQQQDAGEQLETIKVQAHKEQELLQLKLQQKEQQLERELKRNDELQAEVSKLAQEVLSFNQLGDAAKVQNLKSYNKRLNYIIDGFGGVLQIGS